MRAILIDPHTTTVSEVEIDTKSMPDTLQQMHKLIGCDTMDAARIGDRDVIWVSDDGLIDGKTKVFFRFVWHHQWFGGRGLITGVTREGKEVSTKMNVDELKHAVVFGENP